VARAPREPVTVQIDFDGIQQRILAVPAVPAREYSRLRAGVDGTVDLVREVMEGIVSLEVPLVVDIGTGPSLAEAKA